jgi:RHS repeat-associated protein
MAHWHLTSEINRNKTFWQKPKRRDRYCVVDPLDCTTYNNSYTEGMNVTLINGSHTEYDADGRSILNEQLLGLVIDIDSNGRSFVKSTGQVIASSSTEYNNAGWVVSSTDSYGLRTEYTYNVFGETTQTRRELIGGGWLVSESIYDSQGRVVFSTDSHLEGSTDPVYGTKSIYDSKGRSVGSIRYVNSEIEIAADGTSSIKTTGTEIYRTTTEYDSKGRVKSSTDAYGNTTTYEYDNLDRQVAVNTSTGLRSETVYNSKGQVEKSISNIKINNNKTYDYSESIITTNIYNSLGQIVKTETDGRIVEYEYDSLGRQIATIDHPVNIDGQIIRHRSESVYDELGRVSISRTNVKQFSDGTIDRSNVQELKYVYDYRGNVVKTIYADGTFITAEYNDLGQKISETNQLGLTRQFEYDLKGQLIAVVLPTVFDPVSGKSVSPRYEYQYDEFGRQTLIRDPNGHETRFEYDAFGNQISRTLPLGFGADGILGTADDDVLPEGDFTERFEYDRNGRVKKQISFEGVIITFTYDDQGRVKSKTYFENQVKYFTNSSSQTWHYEYDSHGRITKINQNGRVTETTYDSQGRTTSIKTPEGIVYYEYDKFGRQTRVSSNKGDNISYTYDLFGRLDTVTNNASGDITKYEYSLIGNLARTITKTSATTLITTYEYDNMNRLIKETNFVDKNDNQKFDDGEGISQFAYTLDKQGKKINAIEKFWKDINNDSAIDELFNDIHWTYDDAGRLIKEVFDHYDDNFDQTSDWIYDLVGNRLKQTINGKDTTYNYDSNDRLLQETSGEKITVYGYDHTQQTSKVTKENGELVSTTTYEYDLQGRMSVVTITTNNRTEITRYEYGADGIRVSAEHEIYIDGELQSKTRTEYLNDPQSLTGYSQVLRQTEYDANGNVIKTISYVIGHQRISQTIESNGGEKVTYYFTFDGHGSTRVLLDFAGAVAQIYAFDAYGNALSFNTAEALTEFLYSGEQFDSKIGQQYLRQRYYDPTTGRFNRLDPFFGNQFDPQSFHKYLYANADSINYIDPSGEFLGVVGAFFVVQAIIAALTFVAPYAIGGAAIGVVGGAAWGGYNYGWQGALGYGAIGLIAGGTAGIMFAFSPLLLTILTVGYWTEYMLNGSPSYPDANQAAKLEEAKRLIRETPGYGSSYIPTTILIADTESWSGLSPNFAPFSIYLRKEVLELPTVMIASTIVHESVHQTQIPILKSLLNALGYITENPAYEWGEYSPYHCQANFLRSVFMQQKGKETFTISEIQRVENYPSNSTIYESYLTDLQYSFEYNRSMIGNRIENPPIIADGR